MATKIYFNGRITAIPGSYSEVDASGLAAVALASTGIVAILGEAEGGEPDVVTSITNPGKVARTYRDGDLLEAGQIVFDPSKDPDIPAGAAEVKFVKVNPATQSTATLINGSGDALDVTSEDWGLFTTQISLEIADGTTVGKAITVTDHSTDTVESYDDVGGVAIFTALYTPGANGADTMVMDLDNGVGVSADFTKASVGLDSEVTAPSLAEAVQVVSDNAADVGMTATIYGLDAAGDPQTEVLTLNGLTPAVGTATWQANGVLGVILSAAAAGNVSVACNPTTATVVFTLAPAALTGGVLLCDNLRMSGSILTLVADGATTKEAVAFGFVGQTATGEKFTLNGTTPVPGTVLWTDLTVLALGQVEAARTVTGSGEAVNLPLTSYASVSEVANFINTLDGWTVTVSANGGPVVIADMDDSASSTVIGAAKSFFGDLAAIVSILNEESQLVTAAAATGATGAPSNTAAPVFLSGGVEGTTTITEWQSALDKLRDEFVSTVVVLSNDAAVHAAVVAHCAYMVGAGRKERDCVLGAAATETLAQIQARAAALNTRHARLVVQQMDRFNVSGVRETFPPYFLALVAAGMQAGSAIGESLTFKYLNVLDVTGNDASYTLQDDANTLIESGLCMVEPVQGVGFRWLRNVTTHLADDNVAFVEASVNEAVNYATLSIRTALEDAVGRKGFAGTVNAAAAIVLGQLGVLTDPSNVVVTAWRNLTVELEGDVLTVDVELAPVTPVNFVKTTIHLVTASFAAAA